MCNVRRRERGEVVLARKARTFDLQCHARLHMSRAHLDSMLQRDSAVEGFCKGDLRWQSKRSSPHTAAKQVKNKYIYRKW